MFIRFRRRKNKRGGDTLSFCVAHNFRYEGVKTPRLQIVVHLGSIRESHVVNSTDWQSQRVIKKFWSDADYELGRLFDYQADAYRLRLEVARRVPHPDINQPLEFLTDEEREERRQRGLAEVAMIDRRLGIRR